MSGREALDYFGGRVTDQSNRDTGQRKPQRMGLGWGVIGQSSFKLRVIKPSPSRLDAEAGAKGR